MRREFVMNVVDLIRPSIRGRLLVPAAVALAVAGGGLSAAPDPQGVASPTLNARTVRASAPAVARQWPRADLVVGRGDTGGWHLFVTSAAGGWHWRALASVLPFAAGGQRWIGDQCLTSDGRYVVAVTAPWAAQNTAWGRDAGGDAYAIEVDTGRVRTLASGVGLAYFNPGCGTGDDVALTGYVGADEAATRLALVDARTAVTRWRATLPGELTSAVPTGDAITAAGGGALLRIARDQGTRGGTTTLPLPRATGPAYDLRPNGAGGVDFLTPDGGGRVTIWRSVPGRLAALGTGRLGAVALAGGVGGRTLVVGAATLRGGGPLPRVQAAGPSASVLSPDGRAAVVGDGPTWTVMRLPGAARATTASLPAAAPATPPAATPRAPAGDAAAPVCAVPRNALSRQVLQPNAPQVQWAVQQAVRATLTVRRGAPYGIADYAPSLDFPPVPLQGDRSAAGTLVPPQVLYGIFAQESNWAQASWHALPGLAGNPLIANYYGDDPTTADSIDYTQADCGYGLGQLTDLMRAGAPSVDPQVQARIAVDYAENAAAAAWELAGKWNQLATAGIVANNGDPAWLENWYFAAWAYNSGVNPQASTGGNGCIPGPRCTDGAGNWGLGWANNPINPVYNPNRQPFLRTNYADASHPQDWPYQEKVFGWMETPFIDLHGNPSYPSAGRLLLPPTFNTFCDPADNHCDPTRKTGDTSTWFCQLTDLHCWWHAPATWADCASGACHPGSFTIDPSAAEPATVDPHPPVCGPDPTAPAGTIVVDDEATVAGAPDLNLAGCPPTPSGWVNGGTFATTGVTDGAGHDLPGAIDWHQLGAGFGGHLWFTHTRPASDTARTVTGIWTPTLPRVGSYEIRAFIPDTGAATTQARYAIADGSGATSPWVRYLDQSQPGDQWVSLGFWHLAPGASVSLSNVTADGNGTVDIAFDAVEFIPVAPGSYVSLGDSYSSGEGVWPGPFDNGTDVAVTSLDQGDWCHRSDEAYARQYAALTATFAHRPVVHLACSGANLYDVSGAVGVTPNPDHAGNAYYDEPYQVNEIPHDARLVTLSVGGNDVGFADIIQTCAQIIPTSTPCQNAFPTETRTISNTFSGLVATYMAVKQAAPQAQVWVLTYPNIFSTDPNAQSCTFIQSTDLAWLIARTHQLDTVIKLAARQAKVHVLDEEHAFAGHEECTTDTWVTGPGIVVFGNDAENSAFHPDYLGYQKEAEDLKNAVPIP